MKVRTALTSSLYEDNPEPSYDIRLPNCDNWLRLSFVDKEVALLIDKAFRDYERIQANHPPSPR